MRRLARQTVFAAEFDLGFAHQLHRLCHHFGRGFRLALKPGLDFGRCWQRRPVVCKGFPFTAWVARALVFTRAM
ncbi:MAG TPA: hypothetical protein DEV93_03880 [Chloroflexi bacterium]|nr:hypothetical protein [Chloroflexota bacterium]